MISVYYKIIDDIQDSGFLKAVVQNHKAFLFSSEEEGGR